MEQGFSLYNVFSDSVTIN